MSSNSSNSSPKQRKLSELRVVDLQKELQNFGIPYDKKDLKGSLVEKLRQALIHRNIDPERYIFNESNDSKSFEPEQIKQITTREDSDDIDDSDEPQLEIDPEPAIHDETLVLTNVGSSTTPDSRLATTSTDAINDDSTDQTHPMDTIDLKKVDENCETPSIFLTIKEISDRDENDNNNEKMDHASSHTSCSTPDRDLQADISYEHEREMVDEYSTSSINDIPTTADSDHQAIFDSALNEFQLQSTSTEDKSNDDSTLVKSDTDANQSASIDTTDQQTNQKVRRNQCHLWVSNIAKQTHAAHLKELFSKYGKVLATKVISSSSSRWFGYITMATPEDVEKCINALHETELHGKRIYVDWDMHDSTLDSKSKSDHNSTSSKDVSQSQKNESDYRSNSKSSSRDETPLNESSNSSKKRPSSSSSSNGATKKLSTPDRNNRDEPNSFASRPKNFNNARRRNQAKNNHPRPLRPNSSRSIENSDPSRSSDRSYESDRRSTRPINESPSSSRRPRSNERRSVSSSNSSNRYQSSSTDKSRSLSSTKKYPRRNDSNSKDHHRSNESSNFDSNRRSNYHDDHRLRHEKELFERQQYVQQQEEEKIKEQQRRIAEERERVKREFELLERQRLEIERTRLVLEKEKQDQARELEKQQRRLAEEAKIRDEKLHRIAHGDSKRTRPSHQDSQRGQHSTTNDSTSGHSHSARSYDYRSSTNSNDERNRNRSFDDFDRSFYSDSKKTYSNSNHNQRDPIYRDRIPYRESEVSISGSNLGMDSTSSNQRYSSSSTSQHRVPDPFLNLPARARDMALPPSSSVSTAYDRSNRNLPSSPNSADNLNRRAHSRDRFDSRDYMHETDRRDRSPPSTNKMRREPIDSNQWDRSKSRDSGHYTSDSHKYLSNQYLSESSSSSNQQQGLWASAPPSRPIHHHADLSSKHSYGWQQGSQGSPQTSSTHHSPNIPSSHDRSRSNLSNNQRLQMLPSNQTSAQTQQTNRPGTTNQTHLYGHSTVAVGNLSSPQQQHSSLQPPPPQPLHHATTYVTQSVPPTGLLLHSSAQTRPYESHYVVTQPLPPQRRY